MFQKKNDSTLVLELSRLSDYFLLGIKTHQHYHAELVFPKDVWNFLEVAEMWALLSQKEQGLCYAADTVIWGATVLTLTFYVRMDNYLWSLDSGTILLDGHGLTASFCIFSSLCRYDNLLTTFLPEIPQKYFFRPPRSRKAKENYRK